MSNAQLACGRLFFPYVSYVRLTDSGGDYVTQNLVDLDQYVTVAEMAKEKDVSTEAARKWVKLHPTQVHTRKVGWTLLVRRADIEKYIPQGR